MSTAGGASPRNPYPGLRPFREDEEHLFFGRESQVDTMIDKLAVTRFLAVVGMSGSGKSSLVNSGLRPALYRGLMASGGTAWRMVQFRPGNRPVRAMARALIEQGIVNSGHAPDGVSMEDIVEASLRMSSTGLTDIYEAAELALNVNLLLVVDQFEELFRYDAHRAQEAVAFVNLLLEARRSPRIYIVLTMRSDFLGDCAQFPGLPETINEGQYLIPRMTREERRAAIAGPVHVTGGQISPVLLTRLVNDVGDDPDQLSVLQHALNRTWAAWWNKIPIRENEMSVSDYEGIGTMAHALDRHAEKAYGELVTARQQTICERIFKALTDRGTDPRGIRRPTRFAALSALAEASGQEVAEVIEVFRKPSRSFLMPPVPEKLTPETMIDISHESLMRVWERLKTWTDEEAQSAQLYRRLSEAATLHEARKAALWSDPELQIALDWRTQFNPTTHWAELYGGGYDQATTFLAASEARRTREQQEQEESRERELRQAHELAEERRRSVQRLRVGLRIIAVVMLFAVFVGLYALRQHDKAEEAHDAAIRQGRVAGWRALIAAATEMLGSDPELAALLTVEARALRPAELNESMVNLEKGVLARAVTGMYGLSQAKGPEGTTAIAAFSPDGSLTATVDTASVVHVWNTLTGQVIVDIPQQQGIWDVAFSADGKTVMSARLDGAVARFDSSSGSPKDITQLFESSTSVRKLKFGGNGRSLTALGTDGRVVVWDLDTRVRRDLDPFGDHLEWAVLNGTGQELIGAGHDGTLSVWQISPRRLIHEIASPAGPIYSASYSADGRMIVTTGVDKTARAFDAETGRLLLSLVGHKTTLASGAFLPDGRIATVSTDGVARTWMVGALTAPIHRLEIERNAPLEGAQFSNEAAWLATTTLESGRAIVWDASIGRVVWSAATTEQSRAINSFAFSADDALLMTAGSDNTADVWAWKTGERRAQFRVPGGDVGGQVLSVAFGPHASLMLTAGSDGIVRVWDPVTSRQVREFKGHKGAVNSVEVSADGIVATAGADGTARLWSLADGRQLHELRGHASAVALATFSPDARRVITAGEDETIRVWDSQTGKKLALSRAYASKVLSVSFSRDGKWFVSAHADGLVNVGDAGSGELVESLRGHTTWVNHAVFLPDSRTIRTISGDGTVRDIACEVCLPEADLVKLATEKLARVKRELSVDERELHGVTNPKGDGSKRLDEHSPRHGGG